MLLQIWKALTRRKRILDDVEGENKLARVLDVVDLTALGVGSTLGLGVYVLAGAVARGEAGPAVAISFLVAAIASAFAGLCYAEFAARVPKAGSAYIYSYVSVGEFAAFTIGWNLILEYVIGTSSVARGMSNYIDALTGYQMRAFLHRIMPINIDFLGDYPDFFAFVVVLLLAVLLSVGVKESTILNNIFTAVNLITVAVVLVAGSIKADPANWRIAKEDIPANVTHGGEGGFMPFGFAGVMAGAAKCFYGFVGFDCVATTGEEAKNPQKTIPLAIVLSLIIIFLSYFGVSTVLTMMWPYYDQDPDAPFPYVFSQLGWPAVMWAVTVGAVFALSTSLLGAMFPLPRVLYAMADDGLLFRYLAKIHPKTKTPVRATMLSGFFAAVMATIFDLHQLIDMMSIGTLLAYTIVAMCVLILRYQEPSNIGIDLGVSVDQVVKQLFNLNMLKQPNSLSSMITKWGIMVFSGLGLALSALLVHGLHLLDTQKNLMIFVLVVLSGAMILTMAVIGRQPAEDTVLSFKVPCVPLVPCLSIVINLYLMCQLDSHTWIRFAVWIVIGYIIYFFYGMKNSREGMDRKSDEKNGVIALNGHVNKTEDIEKTNGFAMEKIKDSTNL